MADFLTMIALPAVLLAVLVSLGLGLYSMNKSGEQAREQSNRMMRWRIGLQLAALAVILLIVALRQGG